MLFASLAITVVPCQAKAWEATEIIVQAEAAQGVQGQVAVEDWTVVYSAKLEKNRMLQASVTKKEDDTSTHCGSAMN